VARPPDVPGYELVSLLGEGAWGRVWQARRAGGGPKVAVKVLAARSDADGKAAARFRREVAALAGLRHPHVVAIQDAGETADGRAFYAMALVEGEPLAARLARGLALAETVEVLAKVARGLEHGHAAGVVHRDVSPANVLVDRAGEPRLVDFGLASLRGHPRVTSQAAVLGSAAYMAPEAATLDEPGPAADVYALGVILYEALAGQPPFRPAASLPRFVERLTTAELVPPSRVDPDREVPPELEAICLRALSRSPGLRPSAGELAGALEAWLAGRPAPAPQADEAPRPDGRPVDGDVVRAHLLSKSASSLRNVRNRRS